MAVTKFHGVTEEREIATPNPSTTSPRTTARQKTRAPHHQTTPNARIQQVQCFSSKAPKPESAQIKVVERRGGVRGLSQPHHPQKRRQARFASCIKSKTSTSRELRGIGRAHWVIWTNSEYGALHGKHMSAKVRVSPSRPDDTRPCSPRRNGIGSA